MIIMAMDDVNETSCACDTCKAMCNRPCWPTPEEAQRLIDAGYGGRLMLDYWVQSGGDILVLSPANQGSEGQKAAFWPHGRCTFQDDRGVHRIHDQGLKPLEGRVAHHDCGPADMHERIARMWEIPEHQERAATWLRLQQEHGGHR